MKPLEIAKEVRSAVEVWVQHNPYINPESLEGACGLASYTLCRALKAFGYRAQLVYDGDEDGAHCWVELGDEVIDVTATQFGDFPEVYVVHKSEYPLGYERYRCQGRKAVQQLLEWGTEGHQPHLRKIKALINSLKARSVP